MSFYDALLLRLRAMIGNPEIYQVTDVQLGQAINAAHTFLVDRYDQVGTKEIYQFVCVIGTENYTIPERYGAVLKVYDVTNRKPLRKGTYDQLGFLMGAPEGAPVRYSRQGRNIVLYPTPSSAITYKVLAKIRDAEMAFSDDEPATDSTWDDGLLRRARYEFYDTIMPDLQKAQQALASFQEWMNTKPTDIEQETVDMDAGIIAPFLQNLQNDQQATARRFTVGNNWTNEGYPE